jgi:hypothetical protein
MNSAQIIKNLQEFEINQENEKKSKAIEPNLAGPLAHSSLRPTATGPVWAACTTRVAHYSSGPAARAHGRLAAQRARRSGRSHGHNGTAVRHRGRQHGSDQWCWRRRQHSTARGIMGRWHESGQRRWRRRQRDAALISNASQASR